MKKSSKILGSIALSAALVMGTAAPAFAYDGSDTKDGTIDDSTVSGVKIGDAVKNAEATLSGSKSVQEGATANADGSSTIINASTYTSQLSVTIPLSLPLKFDTVGGKGMAPSDGTYYILNNSSTTIAVKKADYKVMDKTMWALGASSFTDSIDEDTNKPSAGVKVGDFYLGITPVLATESNGLKTLALKAVGGDKEKGSASDLNWGINPKQRYGFKLDPSSSKLNMSLDELKPLASVTYTVGVSKAGVGDAVFIAEPTTSSINTALTKDSVIGAERVASVIETYFNGAKGVTYATKSGDTITKLTDGLTAGNVYKIVEVNGGSAEAGPFIPYTEAPNDQWWNQVIVEDQGAAPSTSTESGTN